MADRIKEKRRLYFVDENGVEVYRNVVFDDKYTTKDVDSGICGYCLGKCDEETHEGDDFITYKHLHINPKKKESECIDWYWKAKRKDK